MPQTEDIHIEKATNEIKQSLKEAENNIAEEPVPIPLSHSLDYLYDYGDGWEVKITFTKSISPADELPNDDKGIDPDTVKAVIRKERPICIASDGLPVMYDVGGIFGYVDFLRTIHGKDHEKRKDMRE